MKRTLRALAREGTTLAAVLAHPRTPWRARLVALIAVAYAASPIDLVPDFIPWLGQLDDVLIVGLGALLVRRIVPDDVYAACQDAGRHTRRMAVMGALLVVATWAILVVLIVAWLR